MYQHAKDLGITLITISHRCVNLPNECVLAYAIGFTCRPSLTKYHTKLLTLKGDAAGSWHETLVGTQEQGMDVEREIASLEARLAEVPQWEARLREVANELGVSVAVPKVNA